MIVDRTELAQLADNLKAIDSYIELNSSKGITNIKETDLVEGEILASLLDSQIPFNFAEIPSKSNETSLVGDALQLNEIYTAIKWKLLKLQDSISTQVEIMQLSSEVFIYYIFI